MTLLDFQTALGRLARGPGNTPGADPLQGLNLNPTERMRLQSLATSPGFRFTVEIQRSWCAKRAAEGARFTLSILPDGDRRRLLEEWVNSGEGTGSFFEAQADAFLGFIEDHLTNPSHELTLCRFERATLRASAGASGFTAPDPGRLRDPGCTLRRGSYASLVDFHAEPHRLLEAVQKRQPFPPLSTHVTRLAFAPGLSGLCEEATAEQVALWQKLAAPSSAESPSGEGFSGSMIAAALETGLVELCPSAYSIAA